MFDFSALQLNTEDPSANTVIFAFLLAFFLSSIIAFTYEKTSRQVARPDYFIQGMVLISIVAALVIMAIGDSLARGLGMIGALSIIRFRTTLRNPRNITFMFMAIATGIACGVYGFTIAIIGTIGFCLGAFLLRFTPYSHKNNLTGTLTFNLPKEKEQLDALEAILKKHCERFVLKNYRIFASEKKANLLRYEYQVKLKKDQNGWTLGSELKGMESIQEVRLAFADTEESI